MATFIPEAVIKLPTYEMTIHLPNKKLLTVSIPGDYVTTTSIWNTFATGQGSLITKAQGDVNKELLIAFSNEASIKTFCDANNQKFELEQKALHSLYKEIIHEDYNYIIQSMEYSTSQAENYFKLNIYFTLHDDNGSMLVSHLVKLDKISDSQDNFYNNIANNSIEFNISDL
jgi:hypothetical protein